jgi:hypothetical protein
MRWRGCGLTYLLLVVAAISLAVAASASAATLTWEQSGATDPGAPAGLACPSASLCVAVDARGNAMIATSPATRGSSWKVSSIDAGASLTAVSCPTTQLCVATDRSGRVLTVEDPAAPRATWQPATLADHPWADVSCPVASFCVAVGGQDVAFSNDPAAGPSAWTVVSGVDQSEDYDCGKYQGGPNCPTEPFASVSCPTVSVCEAVDAGGVPFISTDPGQTSGWRQTGELETTGFPDTEVACASGTVCLQDCALGADGLQPCEGNGAYDAGAVLVDDPSTATPARTQVIAPEPLAGLWCARPGCFAARQSGGLLASPDPGDPNAWWQPLVASPSRSAPPTLVFAAVACPSSSLCVGLTTKRAVMIGPPPVSVDQARADLREVLSRHSHSLRAAPLAARGDRQRWRIPVAGTMVVGLYQASTGTLVARGTRSVAVPADPVVTVRLTRAGRRLVLAGRRVRLAVRGTLTPKGRPVLSGTGHQIVVH